MLLALMACQVGLTRVRVATVRDGAHESAFPSGKFHIMLALLIARQVALVIVRKTTARAVACKWELQRMSGNMRIWFLGKDGIVTTRAREKLSAFWLWLWSWGLGPMLTCVVWSIPEQQESACCF